MSDRMENTDPLSCDKLPEPSKRQVGFLLVGHGTRNVAGQEQFRSLFSAFQSNLAANFGEAHLAALAFLELADPLIEVAVDQLAESGATELIVVPVLLFSAGHAQVDIPEAVAEAARKHRFDSIRQTHPLECDQAMLELSARRFREAVCLSADPTILPDDHPCRHECSGKWCSNAALLIVGRGSSSAEAAEMMRQFTRMRAAQTRVAAVETGFIHGQQPDLEAAYRWLNASDLPIAIIQPHLLFEGELIENLRCDLAKLSNGRPEKRWVITNVLGADQQLAVALAKIAIGLASSSELMPKG